MKSCYRFISVLLILMMIVSHSGSMLPGGGTMLISEAFAAAEEEPAAAQAEETVPGTGAEEEQVSEQEKMTEIPVSEDIEILEEEETPEPGTGEDSGQDAGSGNAENSGGEEPDREPAEDSGGTEKEDSPDQEQKEEKKEEEKKAEEKAGTDAGKEDGSGDGSGDVSQETKEPEKKSGAAAEQEKAGEAGHSGTIEEEKDSAGSGDESEVEVIEDEVEEEEKETSTDGKGREEKETDNRAQSGEKKQEDKKQEDKKQEEKKQEEKSGEQKKEETQKETGQKAGTDEAETIELLPEEETEDQALQESGKEVEDLKLTRQVIQAEIESGVLYDGKGMPAPTIDAVVSLIGDLFSRIPGTKWNYDEDYRVGKKDLTVEIEGNLPAGVTARAGCVPFEEEQIYSETALAGVDIALYDADGNLYVPASELTVTIGGRLFSGEIKEGKQLLVYRYSENGKREKSRGEFAADVTVYRDLHGDAGRLLYTTGQKRDSVVYSEDRKGLSFLNNNSMAFAWDSMPLHLLITVQETERTLRAKSGGTEVEVTGPLADSASVSAGTMDAAGFAGELEGEGLLAVEMELEEDKAGSFLPDQPVNVKIRDEAIAGAISDREALELWKFSGEDSPELVENAVFEEDSVEFVSEDAMNSVFVVIGGETPRRTYRFYIWDEELNAYTEYLFTTESGETTSTQIVKNGEKPLVPAPPSVSEKTFAGWYAGSNTGSGVLLEDAPYDFDNIPEITEDDAVDLYAQYRDYLYVIFHDQYSSDEGGFPVAFTRRGDTSPAAEEGGEDSAQVQIGDCSVTCNSDSGMAFYGWSYTPVTRPNAASDDNGDPVEKIEEDTITITQTVHLYPLFRPVCWLTFYTGAAGSGADYIPPAFYYDGEGPSSLTVPKRNGYTFDGWYTGTLSVGSGGQSAETVNYGEQVTDGAGSPIPGADDGDIYEHAGELRLRSDTTLFAKWTEKDAVEYRIVIRKQRTSDAADLADDEKSYEFEESIVLTAAPGTTVSVDDVYKNRTYQGYRYSRCDKPAAVGIGGDTILYVYYDLDGAYQESGEEHTLRFEDSLTENVSPDLGGRVYSLSCGEDLKTYVPEEPASGRKGYTFRGWFADRDCMVSVTLDVMPDHDLTVYAGWESIRYLVKIDPNYGSFNGTGATWFYEDYNGNPIQEYTQVTRDYVESTSGSWYYVLHDRDYYGFPDHRVPEESGKDRDAFYTQDPGEATEYKTFEHAPNSYRYAGWYEVHEDGSETLYDFSQKVDHDTTLRLHWKKLGACYLDYHLTATVDGKTVTGELDTGDSNETVYLELDGSGYADNSSVLVNRTVAPPRGYTFAGWTIRGDQSGRVYAPGQSFLLKAEYAVSIGGRDTVRLDAVYRKVPSARIIYDANGGVIGETMDFGHPADESSAPAVSVKRDETTATVSNLVNNSDFVLSDGTGFSRQAGESSAQLLGWSEQKDYDPASDGGAGLFTPGERYGVDSEEPVTLYAVWGVTVTYHLNRQTGGAEWGDGWSEEIYTRDETGEETVYRQTAVLNVPVTEPAAVPRYTGGDTIMFRGWYAEALADGSGQGKSPYDFSSPVTEDLDLYAYWDGPVEVPVHAADASAQTLVSRDADWAGDNPSPTIAVGAEEVTPDEETAKACFEIPESYETAFAAVLKDQEDLQSLSEEDAVTRIYYNTTDKKVYVSYADTGLEDAALGEGESICFVCFEKKALDIGYRTMDPYGTLTELSTVDAQAPRSTGRQSGSFDAAGILTSPLAWNSGSGYSYYAYAIGEKGAETASALHLVTQPSDSEEEKERPALLVRNTWRGFEYGQDEGGPWTSCGYDVQLYVVYFEKQPSIITICGKTIGPADAVESETFEYLVTITDAVDGAPDPGHAPQSVSFSLGNGEKRTVTAYYWKEGDGSGGAHSQTVTVTQTKKEGYSLEIESGEGTGDGAVWTYTTGERKESPEVTFVNTLDPVGVEVHAALLEADGPVLRDDLRAEDPEKNSFRLSLGQSENFTGKLDPDALFTGSAETYAFGGILYGSDSGQNGEAVHAAGMDAASVSYARTSESGTVCDLMLEDKGGKSLGALGKGRVYYLYYPLPQIRYVKQNSDGSFTEVRGSTDGSTAADAVTYDFKAVNMNKTTVTQGRKIRIEGLNTPFLISQAGGDGAFHMPPVLDDETSARYLSYSGIGAGGAGVSAVSGLDGPVSTGLEMQLKLEDSALSWSTDGSSWHAFSLAQTPTIYAVYTERGYDLLITKSLDTSESGTDPVFSDKEFTVTLRSDAITKESYSVEGTEEDSLPATPAQGTVPGSITFKVRDGSKIRLLGLGRGQYTIAESGNENYLLRASVGPISEGEMTEVQVEDNSTFSLTLDSGRRAALTNTPAPICRITEEGGEKIFYTLGSAVRYVQESMPEQTGEIGMLKDYLLPAGDTAEIPEGCKVTLTTAVDGVHNYSGTGTATITRSPETAEKAMLTNSGSLTLQYITLDGASLESPCPILENSGALVLETGAVLQNGNSTGAGGAVRASGGNITIHNAKLRNNTAASGGAVSYSGNGEIVLSGTAEITGNKALEGDGGAICADGGTVRFSGSSVVSDNSAAKGSGGAVYAAGAVIEVGQNTELSSNSASAGGAVYVESGTVTVADNADIQNNSAGSGNGGAVCTNRGDVTITGGNIGNNTAAGGSGGAVYTESGAVAISGSADLNGNSALSGGAVYAGRGTVTVSGGSIRDNTASSGNGGAVCAQSGAVSLSGGSISGNTAENGSGGALYAGSGNVTISGGGLSGNKAEAGYGGAVYADTGTISVSNAGISGNRALNGAAVYCNAGAAVFGTNAQITGNASSDGGAVGAGTGSVRLSFSDNVRITGNREAPGGSQERNVCLDQDSDTVINTGGLAAGASVGIYVPGSFTSDLFRNRGVAGAKFGTYTGSANLDRFTNDRLPGLSAMVGTNNKIIWGKAVRVEVRYTASFANGFPPQGQSRLIYTNDEYYPPESDNRASNLAADLYPQFQSQLPTAGFACAFAEGASDFEEYLTEINWDSSHNTWALVRRDGTSVTDVDKVILYYAEPLYVSIENNTVYPLEISSLEVLGRSAFNSSESAGYGYVVAVNGATRSSLLPIGTEDLKLAPGKSVKLLFPGACGQTYTFEGMFTGTDSGTEPIRLRRSDAAEEFISAEEAAEGIRRGGRAADTSGGTTEIIFGGDKPICRIVTAQISGVTGEETVGSTEPDDTGKVEYLFSTLRQAVQFVSTHELRTSAIEMLVDYLMPAEDTVTVPEGYDLTFTTAVGGTWQYESGEEEPRAVISRDAGNLLSFISAESNTDAGTCLTLRNLDFDGKALVGSGNGGAALTNNCRVRIENADFSNFNAGNGGAVYVNYTIQNGRYLVTDPDRSRLVVKNAAFLNCISSSKESRQGGGAIWTNAKEFVLEDSTFNACTAIDQGGAVFHRIDTNHAANTRTTVTGCSFSNCEANAAGGLECDAQDVVVTNCRFEHCQSRQRNGGALNIYARNQAEPTAACTVTITDSSFEDCHANKMGSNNAYGGGVRSNALETTLRGCTFLNVSAQSSGGGVSVSNKNARKLEVYGCSFENALSQDKGGAVYCAAKSLLIDDYDDGEKTVRTSAANCSSTGSGGAVYHTNTTEGSSSTINNALIKGCTTPYSGGAVWSNARAMTITGAQMENNSAVSDGGAVWYDENNNRTSMVLTVGGSTFTGNTSGGRGGGIYTAASRLQVRGLEQDGAVTETSFSGNTAAGQGGGIAHVYYNADFSTLLENCVIEYCRSESGAGGGLFTNTGALTIRDSSIANNTAAGTGGGIHYDNYGRQMTASGLTVSGNTSGSMGGGIYSRSSVSLSRSEISGNRLSTNTAADAAGMYLINNMTLTLGTEGASEPDSTSIRGNFTASGAASNLRLWSNAADTENNKSSVAVLCHLSGEIFVVNGRKAGTWFGSSSIAHPNGFTDENPVFRSDDGELHGIIDRTDPDGKKIIWGGPPICKITDENGTLLYFKPDPNEETVFPAVFDRLDNGTANAGNTGAFTLLKYGQTELRRRICYADGTAYTGEVFQVKMLVEKYTAGSYIETKLDNQRWMKIILTTADPSDEDGYPYRGGRGTRATITRSAEISALKSLLNARVCVTLREIILDGGAGDGVTATVNGTLISITDSQYTTVELGAGAMLQNAQTTGNGGAVYYNYGSFRMNGGTIRNCSAGGNGGGVELHSTSKEGPTRGYFTFLAGTITNCTAVNGGGIYVTNNGTLNMSGGTISRCSAQNGGGIYLDNTDAGKPVNMSGGFITGNHAAQKGGGIAFGNSANNRVFFSRKPTVTGNTCGDGIDCNVQLDRDSNLIINTNNGGLYNGATIGIYVPGEENAGTLYGKHGIEGKPFGTFSAREEAARLYGFVNDRNGLKGGILEGQNTGTDKKIYWIKIFSLEVSKQVLSSASRPETDGGDPQEEEFSFKVLLRGRSSLHSEITAADLSGEYGEMEFTNNGRDTATAVFRLKSGEKITAENLDPGFSYEVIEELSEEQALRYSVVPVSVRNGEIGENAREDVDEADRYISRVSFTNVLPVCKITDNNGNLLFQRYTDEKGREYNIPAVYTELSEAVAALDGSLYSGENITSPKYNNNNGHHIEMLTPEYETAQTLTLGTSHRVVLTTASPDAERFPFRGKNGGTAVIRRAFDGNAMFRTEGSLTLENITLDGAAGRFRCRTNGGIIYVPAGGNLTIGTGAVLRNSLAEGRGGAVWNGGTMTMTGGAVLQNRVSENGDGAGIFLAAGSILNLSGDPDFGGTGTNSFGDLLTTGGNFREGELTAKTNGGKEYTLARQDITIEESGEAPASIVLTGNLDTAAGSIWVWAQHRNHYETMMPFAVISADPQTIGSETFAAFRNACPDDLTLCSGDSWLTGSSGENDAWIYWSGGFDVLFKKRDAFGKALPGAEFTLFTDPACSDADAFTQGGEAATAVSADGTETYKDRRGNTLGKGDVLFDRIPAGIYYLKETGFPSLDPDGKAMSYQNDNVYVLLIGTTALSGYGTGILADIGEEEIRAQSEKYKDVFGITTEYAIFRLETVPAAGAGDANASPAEPGEQRAAVTPQIAEYGIMNLSVPARGAIFNKIDTDTCDPLQDARFEILRWDRTPVRNGTEDSFQSLSGGVFRAGTLPYGIYYLHETVVPAGYRGNGEDGWWSTVRVDVNGVEILSQGDPAPKEPE